MTDRDVRCRRRLPGADSGAMPPLDVRQDYVTLMDLFVRLVESRKGEQMLPERAWEVDMQPLAGKLFHHLGTVFSLWDPGTVLPPLAGVNVGYIDASSIAVVCRATFEAFLAFHHIFADADAPALKQFRYRMWTVGGLRSRQGYPAQRPEHKAKLAVETKQIDQLVKEIQADPHFQTLTPGRQKLAVDGEWRLGLGWRHLAVRAGFVEDYFRDVYKLLCGRAHSDYLSVVQFRDATTLEEQRNLGMVYLQFGVVVMSYFIRTYSAIAPKADEILKQYPQAAATANLWYEVARRIADERKKAASVSP